MSASQGRRICEDTERGLQGGREAVIKEFCKCFLQVLREREKKTLRPLSMSNFQTSTRTQKPQHWCFFLSSQLHTRLVAILDWLINRELFSFSRHLSGKMRTAQVELTALQHRNGTSGENRKARHWQAATIVGRSSALSLPTVACLSEQGERRTAAPGSEAEPRQLCSFIAIFWERIEWQQSSRG